MDDGQVIPGLNEDWTFAGAKPMEWLSGLAAAIVFYEFFLRNLGRSMPLFIAVMIGVPILLANVRKLYPDEERGVRNALMTLMGLAPPGIPKPALLQPTWSGAPTYGLKNESLFVELGLDALFEREEDEAQEQFPFYYSS